MSMHLSAPLQTALYQRLTTFASLVEQDVGVFDDAPHREKNALRTPYLTIGDEIVSPWNTSTEEGAAHEITLRIYSPKRGFLAAKAIAADVFEALVGAPLQLSRGTVITHEFIRAKTEREEQGALRRIDLTFRFVIEDTPAA